jgi:hypothetical protein
VLRLFGIPDDDYKRFLNFLASHGCNVDVRPYRSSERGFARAALPFGAARGDRAASDARPRA